MYTTCSEFVVFMHWTGKSMNNLLSYCVLVDPRISASDKDLPVLIKVWIISFVHLIQEPILKLGILNSSQCFDQSDCFWQKNQITNKQKRLVKLVLIDQTILESYDL